MRALVIHDGRVALEERASPEPGPTDALVRVALVGICGTDLALLRGYKAFSGIPGHEMVGVVEKADAAPSIVGRRVVADINVGCGACATCDIAGPGHCPDRRVLGLIGMDGAMAEHVVLPIANLHVVPDDVTDVDAVFAEPLAAACRIPEQLDALEGRRVVVVGAGRLGALCALVLRRAGANVEAVARNARVRVFLDAAGVRTFGDASQVEPGADVVVDATGAPEGLGIARRLVRPRGVVVLKSTCPVDDAAPRFDTTDLVIDEVTLLGSRCGPLHEALELLVSGAVSPGPLLDEVLPLSDGVRAFESAARPGALKVLLAPDR